MSNYAPAIMPDTGARIGGGSYGGGGSSVPQYIREFITYNIAFSVVTILFIVQVILFMLLKKTECGGTEADINAIRTGKKYDSLRTFSWIVFSFSVVFLLYASYTAFVKKSDASSSCVQVAGYSGFFLGLFYAGGSLAIAINLKPPEVIS